MDTDPKKATGSTRAFVTRRGDRLVVAVEGRDPVVLPENVTVARAVPHLARQVDELDPEARRSLFATVRRGRGGGDGRDVDASLPALRAWAQQYPDAAATIGLSMQDVFGPSTESDSGAQASMAVEIAALIVLLLLIIAILWWFFGEAAADLIDDIRDTIEDLEDLLGSLG